MAKKKDVIRYEVIDKIKAVVYAVVGFFGGCFAIYYLSMKFLTWFSMHFIQ